jgi:hypothetical protein
MKAQLVLVVAALACSSSMKPPPVDSAGSAATCANYCRTILAACTAANGQYVSMQTCTSSCMHFTAGAIGDQSGNSLECRNFHATLAQTDPVSHCVHAGPSGGGLCGAPCEGFCTLAVAECPTQYASAGACASVCANFAATPAYTDNVQSGNSLSCRIYEATLASTAPSTACPNTAAQSTVCQ